MKWVVSNAGTALVSLSTVTRINLVKPLDQSANHAAGTVLPRDEARRRRCRVDLADREEDQVAVEDGPPHHIGKMFVTFCL